MKISLLNSFNALTVGFSVLCEEKSIGSSCRISLIVDRWVHRMNKNLLIVSVFMLCSVLCGTVNANELTERKLSTLEILPSTEPLLNSEDVAISFIDTGTIKNAAGSVARGPHEITFSLSSDADYPLTVNETVISPGGSFTLNVDLSETNHRLLMPVYSAAPNAEGEAPYDITIDNLNVNACLDGYTENSDSCFKIDHKSVNYHCPSDFNFRDGTKDCRRIDIIPLNLDCPTGMTQAGDTCSQVIEGPVELSCSEDNYAVESGKCVKRTFHNPLPCPEDGELTSGGQCRVTQSSEPVETPCPESYLNTGYQCEKIIEVDPVTTASCPDNMIEHEGLCYFEDGRGSEVNDGNYVRIDETPYVFELKSSNYALIDSQQTCPENYPNEHGYSDEKSGVICLSHPVKDLEFNIRAENCSSGYIKIDGESGVQCLKESSEIEKSAQCLSDQSYNADTGKCEGIDIKPYGDYCGENRTSAGRCNTYSHEPQDIYCPSGLSYNAGKGSCEQAEQKASVKSCQDGFSLNGAKTKCLKSVSAKLKVSCDSGYTRSSNGRYCYREYSQAANRYCDSGWSISGSTCKKKESRGVDSCPSGYTKRNGDCHKIVDKGYSCKWYQKLDGNKCINFGGVTYNANFKYGNNGNGNADARPIHKTSEASTYDPVTGEVVWTIPAMTSANTGGGSYPGGGIFDQQQIQRIAPETRRYFIAPLQAGTSKYCGNGWSLSGDSCKKREEPNYRYCSDGEVLRSGTPPEEAKWRTSWGKTINKHKYWCESKVNASYGCPTGAANLTSNKCYARNATESVGSCRSGYNLNTATGNCERTLSKAANSRCPSGSEWTLDGTQCRYYNERSVNINCPSSYSKSGSECRKSLVVDPILSCDSGFKLNRSNNRCERTITTPKL